MIAYDATNIITDAVRKCSDNIGCVKQYLYSLKNYQGIAGTYSFDENGDVTMPLMIKTVKNGKFVEYVG